MLTIDTIPLCPFEIWDSDSGLKKLAARQSKIQNLKSKIGLLVLSVQGVATAATAELLELETFRGSLLVLCSYVGRFDSGEPLTNCSGSYYR